MFIGSKFSQSHINYIPNINILGHNIERGDQIEQLGVTIDDQLNGINILTNFVKYYRTFKDRCNRMVFLHAHRPKGVCP